MKKILYVNTLYDGGGAEKIARTLYEKSSQFFDNKFVVGFNTQAVADKNVYVIFDGLARRVINRLITKNHSNSYKKINYSYRIINKIIKNNNINLIHLNNVHGHYLGIEDVSKLAGKCKVVWTLHDFWAITGHCVSPVECREINNGCKNCQHLEYYTPLKNQQLVAYNYELKRNNFANQGITFVVPSEWVRRKIRESYLGNERIEVIYNGVDTKKFEPYDKTSIRTKLNIPCKKIIIGIIAAQLNVKQKGMDILIEALSKRDNSNIHIVVAGNSEEIINKLNAMNISNTNLGYLYNETELSQFYSCIDYLINPSVSETFGLVNVEAMSCGTPVMAFKLGPMPEIITEETGWLVSNVSAIGLRQAIDGLEESVNEIGVKAKNCREYVEGKFSTECMVDSYIKLYKELVD